MKLSDTVQLYALDVWGDFGIRHQAFTEKEITSYTVATDGKAQDSEGKAWRQVKPGESSTRNTPVIDTHGWGRIHISNVIPEGLVLYAKGKKKEKS